MGAHLDSGATARRVPAAFSPGLPLQVVLVLALLLFFADYGASCNRVAVKTAAAMLWELGLLLPDRCLVVCLIPDNFPGAPVCVRRRGVTRRRVR